MEEDKIGLVRKLHEEPGGLGGLLEGEHFGGFRLIYSQPQRQCEGRPSPNPCTLLAD